MHEDDFNLKDALIGVGGALPLFIPLELFGQSEAAVIAGLASGLLCYAYSDKIKERFAKVQGPSQEQRQSLKQWLLSRPGEADPEDGGDAQPKEGDEPAAPDAHKGKEGRGGLWVPPQFMLDDMLDVVHTFNKRGDMYFGDSSEGAIALPLNQMYHVFDVSSSGKGKSNRFRLAMMQVVNTCQTYYINPFAATVKVVTDAREIEVWKPIFDRLANKRPIKTGPEIYALLNGLVDEITKRNQQEEHGDFSWMRKPMFVFIDEIPEVYARCPKAMGLLDQIGRSGRQFCVFTWIASQTALVSDIGLSTAAQAQYKTRIYGGGDRLSSGRLMKCQIPMESERALQTQGAGLTLMLADGIAELQFVRAPLVTNEALFAYLKEPPFRKEDWIGGRGARSRYEQTAQYASFSFSSERENPSAFYAQDENMKEDENENENSMKEPLELDENDENFIERHETFTENDESFIATHEDEIAVLMAVVQLQNEGVKITREAIKQSLGWNNAKHPALKAICDKHKIAMR